MKEYILLLILLLSWVLGSCRPMEQPPETVEPASTPTLHDPTTTATDTPKPTETLTPARFTETPNPTPTIVGTVIAMSEPTIHSSHRSPDGEWQAEVVIYDCVPVGMEGEFAFDQLNLIQLGENKTIAADSQLLSCGGLGAFGLAGLFWSPNSRYFYYTNAREGVPDGLCGYWSPPLLRIDVENPVPEFLGIGSLSKDETRLATWFQNELILSDVDEGEIARLPPFAPGTEIGPVTWSPDSQSLVYVQTELHCPLSGNSYVVRLDLPSLEQTLLLESESPTFVSATWDSPNELTLFDENGDQWRYNLATKELQGAP